MQLKLCKDELADTAAAIPAQRAKSLAGFLATGLELEAMQ